MNFAYSITHGDTARKLVDTLRLRGRPLDVTGATVKFCMRHAADKSVYVELTATLDDADQGEVSAQFTAAAWGALTPGQYNCAWHITYGSGAKLTVPDDGPIVFDVKPAVARSGNV